MLKAKQQSNSANNARLFAALGDNTRLQLIDRLDSGKPNSISTLNAGLKLSRQGLTKHLHVLEAAGIVKSQKVGRELQFLLKPEALIPLHSYLELYSEQWDDAMTRLRTFVEDE